MRSIVFATRQLQHLLISFGYCRQYGLFDSMPHAKSNRVYIKNMQQAKCSVYWIKESNVHAELFRV